MKQRESTADDTALLPRRRREGRENRRKLEHVQLVKQTVLKLKQSLINFHLRTAIFLRLLKEIELEGQVAEGVYRKSGVKSRTDNLYRLLFAVREGESLDLAEYGIHEMANAAKRFLAKLPEPLMKPEMMSALVSIIGLRDSDDDCLEITSSVKSCLVNYDDGSLLGHVMLHLHRISQGSDVTKMSAGNLSKVFYPTLTHDFSAEVYSQQGEIMPEMRAIEYLIQKAPALFLPLPPKRCPMKNNCRIPDPSLWIRLFVM